MRAEIERCARLHGAPILVVETASNRRRDIGRVLMALATHGEALGMHVVRLATSDAYARVSGIPCAFAAAERLAVRYDPVRKRVLDGNRRLLKSFGRWREIRPLIAAFALAHAHAVRTIVGTANGAPLPAASDPPHI